MSRAAPAGESARADKSSVAQLPIRALSRPRETLSVAERILSASDSSEIRSFAGQARGISLRELGRLPAAIRQLERTLLDATSVGVAREADVRATLATTLAVAGRSTDALACLDAALGKVSGAPAARIRVRYGSMLGLLGRTEDAVRELRAAVRSLRRAGDRLWEARAALNLAQALIDLGRASEADAALVRAEDLLETAEHPFEAAEARQDRGTLALLEGRFADALGHFDVAEGRYAVAGSLTATLDQARAAAFLSVGLHRDALVSAQRALTKLGGRGAPASERAHAFVRAGEAALAAGDAALAREYARSAERLFAAQGRERGRISAQLGRARARYAAGECTRRLQRSVSDIAARAAQHKMGDAAEAYLLAGELAAALGEREQARVALLRAARARRSRSDLHQVLGWRAAAVQATTAGRSKAALDACDRGLAALGRYQQTLGATETRAAATTYGLPLARIAMRTVIASGDVRAMLRWAERWRSTAFRLPPVAAGKDPMLAEALVRLRLTRQRLREAEEAGRTTGALEREAAALEDEVRDLTLRLSGSTRETVEEPTGEQLFAELRAVQAVEIFVLDEAVHVLLVRDGTVVHRRAGSYRTARQTAQFAEFQLRRAADTAHLGPSVHHLGAKLQDELFGPIAGELDDRPLVLVPPGAFSAIPWGLLPCLADRVFSVAPSATAWVGAQASVPGSGPAALICGPGLRHAEREIRTIAPRYPDAVTLHGPTATVRSALAALDGAPVAHIAAHGDFRADNPMFSSIWLADGPLTVHDLQRLHRAPHRLVLACCDTGAVVSAGADEMLGMLSALLPLGTAGMLAVPIPVPDDAAVALAAFVHDRLAESCTLGEALREARQELRADPRAHAATLAFNAYGPA